MAITKKRLREIVVEELQQVSISEKVEKLLEHNGNLQETIMTALHLAQEGYSISEISNVLVEIIKKK